MALKLAKERIALQNKILELAGQTKSNYLDMGELTKQSSSIDGLLAHEIVQTEDTQRETENAEVKQEGGEQEEDFKELNDHVVVMDLAMQQFWK